MAERLTGYIDRLRPGAVLAIDAPWGEGKTWFGRHWAALLRERDHSVVFINAFEQDYLEDPFLLIAAEINGLWGTTQVGLPEFRKSAAGAMKALLPVATKAIINLAGRVALGSSDLSDDFAEAAKGASESAGDVSEKWVEDKIKNHEAEKASLTRFRQALATFAAEQKKPVVIFIDELDRCRPTFAVSMIERIKHFFEVPNLVFVLLMNREQMHKAICGIYGVQTDAALYLGKFLHLTWKLPKHNSRQVENSRHLTAVFVEDVMKRYGFELNESEAVNFSERHWRPGPSY